MEELVKVKLNPEENPLKQIREALGLSQRDFAKTLGTYQKTVNRWENGQTKPMFSIAQVKALQREMRKLGLDFEDLPDDLN
jgi:putative transcriptional regulator